MKTLQIFLLLVALSFRSYCQSENDGTLRAGHAPGNDYLLKIVKSYFRSDPYRNEFGPFLKHMLNDPILVNKTMQKKTDSSLFSFKGKYKDYNPFSFQADSTEIRLVEKEYLIDDSSALKDTLFVYQLLGYSNGKNGLEAVKDEFSKFNRHYGKHFIVESSDVKNGTELVGARADYFVPDAGPSPLTVGWAKLDDIQNAFVITLRVKRE
jgi:hypothetical protein